MHKIGIPIALGIFGVASLAIAMRRAPLRKGNPVPRNAESHRYARPIIVSALRRVLGREPSLAEIQYCQAVAWLESNYARGWKGEMIGSNNWGSVQCRDQNAPGCILYGDSNPDGTKYQIKFKSYATPEDGAADAVKNVIGIRPLTARTLRRAESVMKASYMMRQEKYYGGFCPNATAKYGSAAVKDSLRFPDSTDATRACSREAIETHAKAIDKIIADIAGALDEPMAMPLGSYPQ